MPNTSTHLDQAHVVGSELCVPLVRVRHVLARGHRCSNKVDALEFVSRIAVEQADALEATGIACPAAGAR